MDLSTKMFWRNGRSDQNWLYEHWHINLLFFPFSYFDSSIRFGKSPANLINIYTHVRVTGGKVTVDNILFFWSSRLNCLHIRLKLLFQYYCSLCCKRNRQQKPEQKCNQACEPKQFFGGTNEQLKHCRSSSCSPEGQDLSFSFLDIFNAILLRHICILTLKDGGVHLQF